MPAGGDDSSGSTLKVQSRRSSPIPPAAEAEAAAALPSLSSLPSLFSFPSLASSLPSLSSFPSLASSLPSLSSFPSLASSSSFSLSSPSLPPSPLRASPPPPPLRSASRPRPHSGGPALGHGLRGAPILASGCSEARSVDHWGRVSLPTSSAASSTAGAALARANCPRTRSRLSPRSAPPSCLPPAPGVPLQIAPRGSASTPPSASSGGLWGVSRGLWGSPEGVLSPYSRQRWPHTSTSSSPLSTWSSQVSLSSAVSLVSARLPR
eukprot:1180014-Prorocentrum_minimum.AAC.1